MHTTDPAALNSDAQDQADMARLTGGHDAALNDLMERHATPVFHFLCRMLGNEDDANDLAQETFVRVFQHRASFNPNAKFSTWLFTIAGNLARNHHRWRARHPNVSLDAAANDDHDHRLGDILPAADAPPSDALAREERAAAVRRAVESLPDDLREAVILCEWQDLPVAEAAAVLSATPKAVESRLYRARKLLRDQLAKWL